MEELKYKIFSLLSEVIDREEFADWLYTDKDVIELIDKDPFVFELVCLDYKIKSVLYSVKVLVFEQYDYDEFLVFVIEANCSKLIDAKSFDEMYKIVLSIGEYHDCENAFSVIERFYYMDDDFLLTIEGVGWESESDLKGRMIQYAQFVLGELRDRSLEDKIHYIKQAGYPTQENVSVVDEKIQIVKEEEVENFCSKKKKWYEFWK